MKKEGKKKLMEKDQWKEKENGMRKMIEMITAIRHNEIDCLI